MKYYLADCLKYTMHYCETFSAAQGPKKFQSRGGGLKTGVGRVSGNISFFRPNKWYCTSAASIMPTVNQLVHVMLSLGGGLYFLSAFGRAVFVKFSLGGQSFDWL